MTKNLRRPIILACAAMCALFLLMFAMVSLFAHWVHEAQSKERLIRHVVEDFLNEYELPGAVVAYGRPESMPNLYAYGLADREKGRPMLTTDRFRLASLSKPVTSAVALELIRSDDALDLSSSLASVFDHFDEAADPRISDVTIENLLNHTAGWDRTKSFDPFFWSADELESHLLIRLNADDDCSPITDAMLNFPLQTHPGQVYSYSNIGYCWLARIIEARSNLSYESATHYFLKEDVSGLSLQDKSVTVVHEMRPEEAHLLVLRPQVAAAAGGWIGSAGDYFNFAKRPVDNIALLRSPSAEGFQYYGLGWRIWDMGAKTILTHYGAMPGVFALVARASNGPIFVALFNGRPENDGEAFQRLLGVLIEVGIL